MPIKWSLVVLAGLLVALGGCGSDDQQNSNNASDDDNDGFTELAGDCNDRNPAIHPDAVEVVDGVDNNCDGLIDDDLDGDGFGVVHGDCNDNDRTIHPLAGEICGDEVDNNCNGYTDTEEPDKDGDGYGPCHGDCNDYNPQIGPDAVEDPTDDVDNDCDGGIDELEEGCDCGGEPGLTLAERMARAMGFCNANLILDITLDGNPSAYNVYEDWGVIVPKTSAEASGFPEENCNFVVLASGPAKNPSPQDGDMDLGVYMAPDPGPLPHDGAEVNDLTQFKIRIKVPVNATGFSFDFIFFSVEYPEFVCTVFNDTFYALVIGDPALNNGERTNISFDDVGNEITVNAGFFEYPPYWSLDITGTAYEHTESYSVSCNDNPEYPECSAPNPCPNYKGSTTGWLRTTSPATPGEEIEIIFSVHDEGDNILDSAVIVDNFRWKTVPIDGPGTVK